MSKWVLVWKAFEVRLASDDWYMVKINGVFRTKSGVVQAVVEVKKAL